MARRNKNQRDSIRFDWAPSFDGSDREFVRKLVERVQAKSKNANIFFDENHLPEELMHALGKCLSHAGRFDEARTCQLCEETQELERAKSYFEAAQESANTFGDTDLASDCASHIAEILEYEGRPADSVEAINKALLQSVDAETKLQLLNQRLIAECQLDDEAAAQKTYDEAKALVDKENIDEGLFDINLTVARFSWQDDRDGRLQAMKIWADALGKVFAIEVEQNEMEEDECYLDSEDDSLYTTVMGPILSAAALPPYNPTPEEFDELLADTKEWLAGEFGSPRSKKANDLVDFILSPFQIVKAILPVADSPQGTLRAVDEFLAGLDRESNN